MVTSYRLLKISTERLPWLCRITRKSGSCDALQLEAARRRFNYEAHNEPGYKFNNSRRKYFVNQWAYNLCFGKIHIARTHKRLFRSELPYKILTSLLDSATLIFWEKNNILAIKRRFRVFYGHTNRNLPHFLFPVYLTNDREHVSLVALRAIA